MEIPTIELFLAYFEKIRERTLRVVRVIPPDKLEWTYREGKFTLGDLARHVAAVERQVFAEQVQGNPTRYAGCGRELADGLENLLAYMQRRHQESMQIFSRLTSADLKRKVRATDGSSISTWKLLRAMVEHEVHHRGELYVYLGMLGIQAPPLYGMTSEQLREVSRPAVRD